MTAEPYVNMIPLIIGGKGRNEVRDFYANHFVSKIPPDMEVFPGRWRSGRITLLKALSAERTGPQQIG
jgi:hypothetical protein